MDEVVLKEREGKREREREGERGCEEQERERELNVWGMCHGDEVCEEKYIYLVRAGFGRVRQ